MGALKKKVAIVTGGARGIGKAICLALASSGADIVVNDVVDKSDCKDTVDEIMNQGVSSIYVKADISQTDEAKRLVEESLQKMEKVDILVNNAGITRDNLLMRMSEEQWDQVIAVNLKGSFNCLKAVTRSMIKQRNGSIINLSSVVGIVGNAGQANYSASKAGLIGLTKSAARELAGKGIRVNAVAPGFIDTEMTRGLAEEYSSKLKEMIPMGFFGKPDDVANVVVFLASDAAAYVTGEVIKIDGGLFA